jgi:hypothetical protein
MPWLWLEAAIARCRLQTNAARLAGKNVAIFVKIWIGE